MANELELAQRIVKAVLEKNRKYKDPFDIMPASGINMHPDNSLPGVVLLFGPKDLQAIFLHHATPQQQDACKHSIERYGDKDTPAKSIEDVMAERLPICRQAKETLHKICNDVLTRRSGDLYSSNPPTAKEVLTEARDLLAQNGVYVLIYGLQKYLIEESTSDLRRLALMFTGGNNGGALIASANAFAPSSRNTMAAAHAADAFKGTSTKREPGGSMRAHGPGWRSPR